MKSFPVLFVLLATALSSAALATPHMVVRRQDDSSNTTVALCAGTGATLLSTDTMSIDGFATALELSTFACAGTPPVGAATFGVAASVDTGLAGLFWWLENVLSFFCPPVPPVKPTPPAKTSTVVKTSTKTSTVTKTSTATKTSTKTSTATKTSTTTKTATSVSTATATETATLTQVETTTETDTETEIETTTDTATLTVTATVSAASPTSTATDVCGEICTTVCAELGQLPPTTEDCQQLVNAITILNGQIAPEFTVQPNHVQTISFGTCRFFFENVGPEPLSYCWTSLTQVASAAASQCLPPNQPVLSEGLCIPSSGLWEVGVAHS